MYLYTTHPSLRSRLLTSLLCAASVTASPAFAADEAPAMREQGALQYRCGGIGKDESTAMRSAMKDYPLSLLFAAKDGEYLADLTVTIEGGKQTQTFTASGPVCLLKLPAGSYTVSATTKDGQNQKRQVRVGAKHQSLDLRF